MSETTDTTPESEATSQVLAMQVSVEQLSDVERKLAVEVPWTDVKKRLDEAYRELQQGVAIKGFRRGKVPRKMLEQLFGKHVTKEVAQRLVQESIPKAFSDNGLSPVSEPDVVDEGINEGEDFRYSAVVQVVPEIEPKDYFGIEVKQRPAKVTDEDVEAALRMKQRELTAYKAIEGRTTQAGDVLLVDLMGKVGDRPYDRQQQLVELGDPPHEPLAGLAAKLTGIAPDTEELDLELAVPVHDHGPDEPCPETEKTEPARLLVTIRDAKQKVVPALDDELARDSGEAETLDELKQVLKKKLVEQDEGRAKEEAKQGLLQTLVGSNEVPLVPALVERYLDQSIKLQLALMGIDPSNSPLDENVVKEQLRGDAEEKVRSGILLEAIGKKEKVEVSDADLEKRLAEIAAARSQNIARVRSEYEKEGRMAAIRGRIREDKTLDLLMAKANIIIEEGTAETNEPADKEQPGSATEPAPAE